MNYRLTPYEEGKIRKMADAIEQNKTNRGITNPYLHESKKQRYLNLLAQYAFARLTNQTFNENLNSSNNSDIYFCVIPNNKNYRLAFGDHRKQQIGVLAEYNASTKEISFIGQLTAEEIKQDKYWNYSANPPCWMVPRRDLHSMEEIIP